MQPVAVGLVIVVGCTSAAVVAAAAAGAESHLKGGMQKLVGLDQKHPDFGKEYPDFQCAPMGPDPERSGLGLGLVGTDSRHTRGSLAVHRLSFAAGDHGDRSTRHGCGHPCHCTEGMGPLWLSRQGERPVWSPGAVWMGIRRSGTGAKPAAGNQGRSGSRGCTVRGGQPRRECSEREVCGRLWKKGVW